MPTVTLDGKTKVSWLAGLDSIVDITAPTVGELADELVLESATTPDGLNITPTTGKIDNSNLGSTFTTNTVGRRSFDNSIKLHRQSTEADEIAAALVYEEEGYLLIRRGYPKALPWAVGQPCEVYPIECGEPAVPQSAAEQLWDYMVPLTVTDDPCTTAVVAA